MEVEPGVFSRTLGTNLKQYQVRESRFSVNKREDWTVCHTRNPG